MNKWFICKECETIFHPCSTLNVYCSRECAKKVIQRTTTKYQKQYPEKHKEWQKKYYLKHPELKIEKLEFLGIFEEIARYCKHRLKLFSHFYNKEKGIGTRWKFVDAWKQRLEQMDAIFIDELVKNCMNTSVSFEKIEKMFIKAINNQNKHIEERIGSSEFNG